MSQPQIQSRTSMVNGVSRRQGDRDLGNRPQNSKNDHQSHRPFRSSPSLSASTGAGQQHVNQINSTFTGQAANPKNSGDNKVEAPKGGENRDGFQEPLNQHLLYLTACLIGQLVEVQVKNGSIYSGVFHTASAEKDYGIVLRIARLVRNGLSKGKNDMAKDLTRRPVKTLVIQAKDLVQINAKDVPISAEVLQNGRARENRAEIITDSFLSQGKHGEVERELKPWTPDNDDFRDLGLDSTFQNTWNRNWDQFEINKTLFGVESTFDEELYTTKLNRGPQSREREREAWRIAREIEAQSTKSLHVVEERSELDDFDALDEEGGFSSVLRSSDAEEIPEGTSFDVCNFSRQAATSSTCEISPENFGETESRDFNKPDFTKFNDVDSLSSSVDLMTVNNDNFPILHKEKLQHTAVGDSSKHVMKVGGFTSPVASIIVGDATSIQALNLDPGCPQVTEDVYRDFNVFRQQENAKRGKKHREDQVNELKSFSESLKDLTVKQQTTVITGSTCKTAAVQTSSAFLLPVSTSISTSLNTAVGTDAGSLVASSRSLSSVSSEGSIRALSNEVEPVSGFPQVDKQQSSGQHSSETANASLNTIPSTTTPSSPSSSSGVSTCADSVRRSTLNPNAKEFKLNPNAKSFTPSFTPLRPPSPVVQTPVYVPGVIPSAAQLPNMPVGVGVSSMLQPGGQSATKYTPYNPVAVAPAPGSNPYLPSPGAYTPGAGVTGTAVSPALGGGQASIKVPPQLQQSAVAAQTYASQQPIRYTSQAPSVQPTSTYIHPSGHMYSQQMMFGQPGQVVYIQPYPQAAPIPPPQPGQPSSQQPQPKHRAPGTGVQGVQLCVAPPFLAGQQHFLPQVQVSQLSNPLQPTPGVFVPTTMSAIQPPQGVIGGIVTPTQPNTGASVMRVGGKFVGMNYQQ